MFIQYYTLTCLFILVAGNFDENSKGVHARWSV